jgi:hypothetical protein
MAIDPNKKFLYINRDATLGEMDEALCFPVSSFVGAETQTSSIIDLYFKGSKGTDATVVRIVHEQHGLIKTFYTNLVNEINFGEKAFINIYDHAEKSTFPSDISFNISTDVQPTFTLQDSSFNVESHEYEVTSSTDGDYQGDVVFIGGTTSMTKGALYHYKSDGTWELADADAVATCDGLLAIALGASSDDNGMLLRGMVTLNHDPGSVGDVLFVSTTAGQITATAPSGSGDIVRVVGYCLHATAGMIWFNPDGAFVEVA